MNNLIFLFTFAIIKKLVLLDLRKSAINLLDNKYSIEITICDRIMYDMHVKLTKKIKKEDNIVLPPQNYIQINNSK